MMVFYTFFQGLWRTLIARIFLSLFNKENWIFLLKITCFHWHLSPNLPAYA